MSNGKLVTTTVTELITPVVEGFGLRLWDVEFLKEAGVWTLRITIDSDDGIDINDCEKVHRAIDPLLDEADPIDESYQLEVSSPGIEREIRLDKHFELCMGEKVCIKLFAALNGKKEYTGVLTGYKDKVITVETEDGTVDIDRKAASKIKTVYNF